jgi:hypothetical protein
VAAAVGFAAVLVCFHEPKTTLLSSAGWSGCCVYRSDRATIRTTRPRPVRRMVEAGAMDRRPTKGESDHVCLRLGPLAQCLDVSPRRQAGRRVDACASDRSRAKDQRGSGAKWHTAGRY